MFVDQYKILCNNLGPLAAALPRLPGHVVYMPARNATARKDANA